MPLSNLKVGQTGTISKIDGKDSIQKHLRNLGFVEGEQVAVINELMGNVIVNIKGSRVALNQSIADRIIL